MYGLLETDNFEVEIEAYNTKPFSIQGNKYISLPNKTPYKVKLINNSNRKTDATLEIDGEKIGTWRLRPYSRIILERPANINRKFIFVKENSMEAELAGIEKNNFNNGIVKVTFYPERKIENICRFSSYSDDLVNNNESFGSAKKCKQSNFNSCITSNNDFSSGATILGERSNQEFSSISPITDIDSNMVKTIILRLVVDNNSHDKPYISLKEANTILPPRIEELRRTSILNRYEY